jgi:hypothetical protein
MDGGEGVRKLRLPRWGGPHPFMSPPPFKVRQPEIKHNVVVGVMKVKNEDPAAPFEQMLTLRHAPFRADSLDSEFGLLIIPVKYLVAITVFKFPVIFSTFHVLRCF